MAEQIFYISIFTSLGGRGGERPVPYSDHFLLRRQMSFYRKTQHFY